MRAQPAPLSQTLRGIKVRRLRRIFRHFGKSGDRPASDLVVALGGRTILSEFPELCGVEQEHINRCKRKEVAERFIR